MKTAYIETFYGGGNYGSRLQALGLCRYLDACGFRPVMVKGFKVPDVFVRHPSLVVARLKGKLHQGKQREFFNPSPYEMSAEREARLDRFLAENFQEVAFRDSEAWNEALQQGSVFIAGSDILWQPARGYPGRSFLDYAVLEGAPCFSYASSIGSKELPKKYYAAYRRYLGAFRAVSVREQAAARLLEPIIGRRVTKVVDPTLLHPPNAWNDLAEKAMLPDEIREPGFALCYFVMDDPRYWRYVDQFQKKTGLRMVVLPMHHSHEVEPYDIILDGTPYEFVWLISHAEAVLTDSFHACCFSLQYEKDFYLIRRTRAAEDDKYNDLLDRYRLVDRVVSDPLCFEPKPVLDYSAALEMLEADRIESRAFIDSVLGSL